MDSWIVLILYNIQFDCGKSIVNVLGRRAWKRNDEQIEEVLHNIAHTFELRDIIF